MGCSPINLGNFPVSKLSFSQRTKTALLRFGIDTLEMLIELQEDDIEYIRGAGKKAKQEIEQTGSNMETLDDKVLQEDTDLIGLSILHYEKTMKELNKQLPTGENFDWSNPKVEVRAFVIISNSVLLTNVLTTLS